MGRQTRTSQVRRLRAERERMLDAIADIVRRPLGVIPDSANEWSAEIDARLEKMRTETDQNQARIRAGGDAEK